VEAAVNVDANSTPPVEEEISVKLQPATVIETGDVDANTAPLVQKHLPPASQQDDSGYDKVPMSSAGLRMLLSLYRQVTSQTANRVGGTFGRNSRHHVQWIP